MPLRSMPAPHELAPPNPVARRERVIAVCLAGLSPAVVTEALYALAVARKPPIVPDEVHIITTVDAHRLLVRALLGPGGAIARLRRDYALPATALRCSPRHVLVLRDARNRPLADIRTSADSRAAGEAIAAFLARLKRDPEVPLHCSVAGGRKSMGVLLALALQLVGRPGDRLYHVLVNEPFERIPDFCYPPARPQQYELDGRNVDSRRARIDLAEIPFVRLGGVTASLRPGRRSFAARTAHVEAAVAQRFSRIHLRLEEEQRRIVVDGVETPVSPQDFVIYRLYASLRAACRTCQAGEGCQACHPTDGDLFADHRQALLDAYCRLRPLADGALVSLLQREASLAEHRDDFDNWIRQARSRLARRLREAGGPAAMCAIQRRRIDGVHRHGLMVAPACIEVLPPPGPSSRDNVEIVAPGPPNG